MVGVEDAPGIESERVRVAIAEVAGGGVVEVAMLTIAI
jgi:hypothetical protein